MNDQPTGLGQVLLCASIRVYVPLYRSACWLAREAKRCGAWHGRLAEREEKTGQGGAYRPRYGTGQAAHGTCSSLGAILMHAVLCRHLLAHRAVNV